MFYTVPCIWNYSRFCQGVWKHFAQSWEKQPTS